MMIHTIKIPSISKSVLHRVTKFSLHFKHNNAPTNFISQANFTTRRYNHYSIPPLPEATKWFEKNGVKVENNNSNHNNSKEKIKDEKTTIQTQLQPQPQPQPQIQSQTHTQPPKPFTPATHQVVASSSFSVFQPRIFVVGVGGAGGNAVDHMINKNLNGVEFLVANTDAQALSQSQCKNRIQLGSRLTRGFGAGAKPEIGKLAAEETLSEIKARLSDSNMVFLAAGMGGGTGTGATPIIARELKEISKDILIVAVVTKPFNFEGSRRSRMAEYGLTELSQHVDTMIVISNEKLLSVSNENTKITEAFAQANETLHAAIKTISDLITLPGLINVDYNDIRTILCDMRSDAMVGIGEAEGEDRALKASNMAIFNPLLDSQFTLTGARGVLINIAGGNDLTLHEVDQAATNIQKEASVDANIIFGQCMDHSIPNKIRVSVICAK